MLNEPPAMARSDWSPHPDISRARAAAVAAPSSPSPPPSAMDSRRRLAALLPGPTEPKRAMASASVSAPPLPTPSTPAPRRLHPSSWPPARAWQILLASSWDANKLTKLGLKMRWIRGEHYLPGPTSLPRCRANHKHLAAAPDPRHGGFERGAGLGAARVVR